MEKVIGSYPPPGRRVLLADDEFAVIDVLGPTLIKAGFQVVTARDGETALDLAQTLCPSVIVLDELMPVMRGSEICGRLAASPESANIPVIILTGYGRISAFHPNIRKVMHKPFNCQEVVDAVGLLFIQALVAA